MSLSRTLLFVGAPRTMPPGWHGPQEFACARAGMPSMLALVPRMQLGKAGCRIKGWEPTWRLRQECPFSEQGMHWLKASRRQPVSVGPMGRPASWACDLCRCTGSYTQKPLMLCLMPHRCSPEILRNFETRCLAFLFCFGSCEWCRWSCMTFHFDFMECGTLNQQEIASVHCWPWIHAPGPYRLGKGFLT